MTAEEHNKTLATLHFIYGAIHGLTMLGLLLLIFAVKLGTPAGDAISSVWIVTGLIIFLLLFIVVGLLPIVVGSGFRKRSRWVKPVALVLAVLSFINVPIGTALGIYTITFFRSAAGLELYGGKTTVASESELKDAMSGAHPLMNLADRLK